MLSRCDDHRMATRYLWLRKPPKCLPTSYLRETMSPRAEDKATSRDFASFYRSEFDSVYRAVLAFSGVPDRALDATQEAFSRALARWARLSKAPWAGGWVMTTAMNICRRHQPIGDRWVSREAGEDSDVGNVTSRVDLVSALRLIPPRQREAAILYYFADLSVIQVADRMNLSTGAVKSHLAKARRALKPLLEAPQ
jgi:RNA polymerase sigma-70 factor (ECF subfamily)